MFVPIIFTWLRVRTKRTMSTADLVLALTLGTLPARALGLVHLFASSLVVSSCLTAGGLSDMCLCEGDARERTQSAHLPVPEPATSCFAAPTEAVREARKQDGVGRARASVT